MRVLIYSDSTVFGGHEVMTLRIVEALLCEPEVELHFIYSSQNTALQERLTAISEESGNKLALSETSHGTDRLQAFRNWIPGAAKALSEQMSAISPDLVIVAQGDIENSSLGLLAAHRAGLRCLSYLPAAHTFREIGLRLGKTRDILDQHLFKLPDGFLTISEAVRTQLKGRGVRTPIEIIYNGIDPTPFEEMPPVDQAREGFGIPSEATVIGLAGRIEFGGKQQDFLLDMLASKDAPESWHALLIGDGPDSDALDQKIEELNLTNRVHRASWCDDLRPFFAASDIIAIPSRFEGFPLTMLEAVCAGCPVIATDKDGMQEFLPDQWRFTDRDVAGFYRATKAALDPQAAGITAELAAKVHQDMDLIGYPKRVATALKKAIR